MNRSLNTIRLLRGIAILTFTVTLLLSCVNQQELQKEEMPHLDSPFGFQFNNISTQTKTPPSLEEFGTIRLDRLFME